MNTYFLSVDVDGAVGEPVPVIAESIAHASEGVPLAVLQAKEDGRIDEHSSVLNIKVQCDA